MKYSDIPAKFPIPFASGALPNLIRPIPTPSQTGGAASLTDGFPATAFQPVAAGGIPPAGQDMNGLMLQVTGWARWLAAGGPIFYDADFCTAIGGYPSSVILQSIATPGNMWRNTVDNNLTDPDSTGQTGWVRIVTNSFTPVQQGGGLGGQGSNKVYIGWASDGSGLRCTVDVTDLGYIAFETYVDAETARAEASEANLAAALQRETDSRVENDNQEIAIRYEQDVIASAYYKNNNTALAQNPNGSAEWGMSGGNLIIQWGAAYTDGNGLCHVDFPGNFPVGCFSLNATVSGATTYEGNYLNVSAAAYNGFECFTMTVDGGTGNPAPFVNFYWIAIGY